MCYCPLALKGLLLLYQFYMRACYQQQNANKHSKSQQTALPKVRTRNFNSMEFMECFFYCLHCLRWYYFNDFDQKHFILQSTDNHYFNMNVQQKMPFVLIYYSFRGQAQPIRSLLCYLQVEFVQIHIDHFEKQKEGLPKGVLQVLRRHKIQRSMLPVLIDNDQLVTDVYTIMTYACYKCERQQLLGTTIEEKARLQEILEVYSVQQPKSMSSFFGFAEFVVNHTEQQISIEQKRLYFSLIDQSKYLKQLCDHIKTRNPQKYILSELSVIDFLFFQSCNYMLGGFDNLDKDRGQAETNAKNKGDRKYKAVEEEERWACLNIMREFKERMMHEPFYVKHRRFLESYSILSAFLSEERRKGIKKMWLGDPVFL